MVKKTKKIGAPDGIKNHRKVLNQGHTDSPGWMLKKLDQINSDRLLWSPNSRHPITQQYYEHYSQLTQDLKNLFVSCNKNHAFKTWVTEAESEKAKEIVEKMRELKLATINALENLNANSLSLPVTPEFNVEDQRKDGIRSITYNIQQLLGTADQGKRTKKLLRFFRDKEFNADVIVLQEAFQPGFFKKLEKSFLARDYHVIKPKGCELINSGVCILLKKETFEAFADLQLVAQEDYPSTTAASWDKVVPKGFTHVLISQEEKKTHIVGTHTQAQYQPSQIVATLAQLARLGQYISKLPANEPLQLLGDLNIPRERAESKLLKYLLLLEDQPTPAYKYSYDSEVNPLVKDKDRFTLDYIATRGYEITYADIVINKRTEAISDHFPLHAELKYSDVAEVAEPSVAQQQDRILSQLLQSAYQQIAEKGCQTTEGQRIHFAALSLIEHIERLGELDEAERIALGVGDKFLSYCLAYKLPASEKLNNLYFQSSNKNVLHYALEDLIDYKVNTDSPEVARFNVAANKYLAHVSN